MDLDDAANLVLFAAMEFGCIEPHHDAGSNEFLGFCVEKITLEGEGSTAEERAKDGTVDNGLAELLHQIEDHGRFAAAVNVEETGKGL